jgi:hypothetical protein
MYSEQRKGELIATTGMTQRPEYATTDDCTQHSQTLLKHAPHNRHTITPTIIVDIFTNALSK